VCPIAAFGNMERYIYPPTKQTIFRILVGETVLSIFGTVTALYRNFGDILIKGTQE
jgi:hypothetical protein